MSAQGRLTHASGRSEGPRSPTGTTLARGALAWEARRPCSFLEGSLSKKPRPVSSDAQSLHLRNGHTGASGWVLRGRARKVDHLLQPWSCHLAE